MELKNLEASVMNEACGVPNNFFFKKHYMCIYLLLKCKIISVNDNSQQLKPGLAPKRYYSTLIFGISNSKNDMHEWLFSEDKVSVLIISENNLFPSMLRRLCRVAALKQILQINVHLV